MPSWKKVIVSGSDAVLNSLNAVGSLTASGLTYPSTDNGEESFIQTDGSGTLSLQYVKTIYEEIYNGEATTLVKGTPVYVSGSVGAASQVFVADASDPTKMPVIYISADTLAAGETGRGIALGLIKGVDTTGYPAGTEIFVGVGGGWTSTRPTGSAIVQVLGYVTKEGAGGQGVVLNSGPNNLPNLNSGSVWIGNSSGVPVAVATSSIQNVVSSSFATTAITASHALTASSADNFLVRGTLTAQTIVAQVITSSTDFVTGSTRFGSLLSNTHQFTGSVSITGSLTSNGVTTLRGAGTTTGTAITVQNVNSSELFRVLDNATAGFTGSLGVGTLSPIGYQGYSGAGTRIEIRDNTNNLVSAHWKISAQSASIGLQTGTWDFRSSNPVLFTQNTVNTLYLGTNGRVGIGTTSPDTLLQINSTSTTGSTITLNATGTGNSTIRHNRGGVFKFEVGSGGGSDDYGIYNGAASSYSLRIKSTAGGDIYLNETTGSTGIGTTTPQAKLDVSGSGRFTNGLTVTGSLIAPIITGSLFGTASWAQNAATSSYVLNAVSASFASTASYVNPLNQNVIVTGSVNVTQAVTASTLLISGSGTQRVTIIGSGSAQPILTVQGSQGELFSITDSLSGSLFSVNDISGLPILEVFSDDTILMGDYTAPSLNTTKRIASTTAGVNVIYSLPTSSYDGVFVDYTIRSGSLGRAGNFMAMWSGSSTDFTDNSINGFGNTTGFVFGASISGSNMIVSGSGTTAGWIVKTIIRSI